MKYNTDICTPLNFQSSIMNINKTKNDMNLSDNLLKQLETSKNKYNTATVLALIKERLSKVDTEEQRKPFEDGNFWTCINDYTKQKGFEFLTGDELRKGLKELVKLGYIRKMTIQGNKYYYTTTEKALSL